MTRVTPLLLLAVVLPSFAAPSSAGPATPRLERLDEQRWQISTRTRLRTDQAAEAEGLQTARILCDLLGYDHMAVDQGSVDVVRGHRRAALKARRHTASRVSLEVEFLDLPIAGSVACGAGEAGKDIASRLERLERLGWIDLVEADRAGRR